MQVLNKTVERLKIEVTDQTRSIEDLRKSVKDKDNSITWLRNQAANLTSNRDADKSSPQEMVRELDTLTKEKNEFINRARVATEQYDELCLTYSKLESDSASKTEQFKNISDVNKQLSVENERLMLMLQQLQDEAQKARSMAHGRQQSSNNGAKEKEFRATESQQEAPAQPDFPPLAPSNNVASMETKENVTRNKKNEEAKSGTSGNKDVTDFRDTARGMSKDVHLPPDIPRQSPVSGIEFMQETEADSEFSLPVTTESTATLSMVTQVIPDSQISSVEITETSERAKTSERTESLEGETSDASDEEQPDEYMDEQFERYYDQEESESEGRDAYDYSRMPYSLLKGIR